MNPPRLTIDVSLTHGSIGAYMGYFEEIPHEIDRGAHGAWPEHKFRLIKILSRDDDQPKPDNRIRPDHPWTLPVILDPTKVYRLEITDWEDNPQSVSVRLEIGQTNIFYRRGDSESMADWSNYVDPKVWFIRWTKTDRGIIFKATPDEFPDLGW